MVDEEGLLVGINASPGLIVMVERLTEVLPILMEGKDIAVAIEDEILYAALDNFFSQPFLFATDADGNGERLLPGQWAPNSWVERSPDGTKLVYASPRGLGSNWDIYMANADGSEEIRLTFNNGRDLYPSWGPKGEKLVFLSDRDGNDEIYVMNADGTGKTRMTDNDAVEFAPHISPDGSRIVFSSNRDGNEEIYVMDASGSDVRRITNSDSTEEFPRWSPDGQRIVFDSDLLGNLDIYTMDADGSNGAPRDDCPASTCRRHRPLQHHASRLSPLPSEPPGNPHRDNHPDDLIRAFSIPDLAAASAPLHHIHRH